MVNGTTTKIPDKYDGRKTTFLSLAITVIITAILLERVRVVEWNSTTQFSDTLVERGK